MIKVRIKKWPLTRRQESIYTNTAYWFRQSRRIFYNENRFRIASKSERAITMENKKPRCRWHTARCWRDLVLRKLREKSLVEWLGYKEGLNNFHVIFSRFDKLRDSDRETDRKPLERTDRQKSRYAHHRAVVKRPNTEKNLPLHFNRTI